MTAEPNWTWDKKADAMYIYVSERRSPGMVSHTYTCPPAEVHGHEINLDFDGDGHLMGIEILSASKVVVALKGS